MSISPRPDVLNWWFEPLAPGGAVTLNWGFFLLRLIVGTSILSLLFFSQRFWYRALWRVTANWNSTAVRVIVRLLYVIALMLVILATADALRAGRGRFIPRGSMIVAFTGLWMFSALFGFIAVKSVRCLDRGWTWLRRSLRASAAKSTSTAVELLADPSRRYFFRAASAAAGAAPFLGAVYGFAAERLNYQVRRVEIPIPNLPPALDGMHIVQLSDIHLSGYMPRAQVRRAVDMANDLGADLAVVTGDFITGASDPLGDCIEEIRRLYAPLGTWGCNGNHEIYARAEDAAQLYFAQAGMKLLRHENAQITFKGAQFNLIGVDYQRERNTGGHTQQTLAGVEPLVRRDMPNILLSHNPNSFNRAAELGIELSLAGHTHGGQIQVEILDHRLSPARFITDYIAGHYQRPLFLPASTERAAKAISASEARGQSAITNHFAAPLSSLYVNRGLGTVGAPVRLGVPPEITLLKLRSL
jgi:predicted MPP superfamily phosphohydrolase